MPLAPTGLLTVQRLAVVLMGLAGMSILALNVAGLAVFDLRPGPVESYQDFAGSVTTPYPLALARLEALPVDDPETLAVEATRAFHEGMAHVDPGDRALAGVGELHMTVPVWENWLLFLLAYVKPDTYRDYEFCNYRRALERGAGRCGQQSLALVDFLSARDIPTGFVNLGGHTVVTAKINGQWILLDPDYGGVIPFDLAQAEAQPAAVIPYYWNDQIVQRNMFPLFGSEGNEVRFGGPEARWGRACAVERVSYWLKWLLPALLIAPGGFLLLSHRRASG